MSGVACGTSGIFEMGTGIAGYESEVSMVPPKTPMTTLMFKKLPSSVGNEAFAEEVDRSGFANLYDFLYVPRSLSTSRNKGFAFVNFVREDAALTFAKAWHKGRHCGATSRKLEIAFAEVQGYEENVALTAKKLARVR